MEREELKIGDRVKFWWNWCQREGRVSAIRGPDRWSEDTMYEVEEVPGCNRVLFREEISEKLKGE